MPDAANVVPQRSFVLNSVQHKFFHVSIVKNLHILLEKSAEGLGPGEIAAGVMYVWE